MTRLIVGVALVIGGLAVMPHFVLAIIGAVILIRAGLWVLNGKAPAKATVDEDDDAPMEEPQKMGPIIAEMVAIADAKDRAKKLDTVLERMTALEAEERRLARNEAANEARLTAIREELDQLRLEFQLLDDKPVSHF